MKEIKLTQGYVTYVDDADYEWLMQYRWCANNCGGRLYASRWDGKSKRNVLMHRMILNPASGLLTDHIDGDGLNNQRCNLRAVTVRQNSHNLNIPVSSRYPGVHWFSGNAVNRWRSSVRIGNKRKHLGCFLTEEEAFEAYQNALNEIGETVIARKAKEG